MVNKYELLYFIIAHFVFLNYVLRKSLEESNCLGTWCSNYLGMWRNNSKKSQSYYVTPYQIKLFPCGAILRNCNKKSNKIKYCYYLYIVVTIIIFLS